MPIDAGNAFLWSVAGAWSLVTLGAARDVATVPTFPGALALGLEFGPDQRPSVSVIVPARDEEARIETTVRRLLAQEGVEVEIVVVDDRSTDRTGEIVERITQTDPRVKSVRVDALPAGWLGKTHACQVGGERARGEWLLFTDGDVWMASDAIARAIAYAGRTQAQHVTLGPRSARATFAARVALSAFAIGLVVYMARANRDRRSGAVGIGAFNLVRADAWRAIGGHTHLAYEVVDDLRLGTLLRRGGFRTRACVALEDVEAEWGGTLHGIVRALEKNVFANLGYSVWKTLELVIALAAMWTGALVGPFASARGALGGWAALLAMMSLAIPSAAMARRAGDQILPAVFTPIATIVLAWAALNSMLVTLRQGGVVWRGTLYPLSELRARRVR
jgi:glycosyltransferase involved in cell wall biosynthesis